MLKLQFFLPFSLTGFMIGGVLLVIPLEFQEIKHQPFSGGAFLCAGSTTVFTAANAPLKQGQMNDL
ncbi:hypothetical protein [uncultured Bilophila sp.]|uniref:hypothetical protein n=1 Tax=uncultured Bilophila sp. TaxID=529385 RepID=UPI00266EAD1E|nr:hypothetical protein [uncultured Bilophila sp.]